MSYGGCIFGAYVLCTAWMTQRPSMQPILITNANFVGYKYLYIDLKRVALNRDVWFEPRTTKLLLVWVRGRTKVSLIWIRKNDRFQLHNMNKYTEFIIPSLPATLNRCQTIQSLTKALILFATKLKIPCTPQLTY